MTPAVQQKQRTATAAEQVVSRMNTYTQEQHVEGIQAARLRSQERRAARRAAAREAAARLRDAS